MFFHAMLILKKFNEIIGRPRVKIKCTKYNLNAISKIVQIKIDGVKNDYMVIGM